MPETKRRAGSNSLDIQDDSVYTAWVQPLRLVHGFHGMGLAFSGVVMLKDDGSLLVIGLTAAVAVAAAVRSGSRAEATSAVIVSDGRVHATALGESDKMFFRALGLKGSDDRFSGTATPFIERAIRRYRSGVLFGIIPADGEPDMDAGLSEAESRLGLPNGSLAARGVTPGIAARVARVSGADPVGVLDARARFNGALLDSMRKMSDLPGAMEHRLLEEIKAWAKGYGARSVLLIGDRSTDRASWMSLGFAPLFEENGLLLAISRFAL